MRGFSDSYRAAGVDIEAGYEGVRLMKPFVERTKIPGVVSGIGGFGGFFTPDLSGMAEPVLVSGTDGVGTKLRVAQFLNKHDSIGIDCVAMCVNDIICCGAKPLFFLDYIAIGKNDAEKGGLHRLRCGGGLCPGGLRPHRRRDRRAPRRYGGGRLRRRRVRRGRCGPGEDA